MRKNIHKQLNKIAFTCLENIGFKKSDFFGRDIFPLRDISKDFIAKKVFPFELEEFGKISGVFEIKLKNYKIVHFCFTVL